MKTKINLKRYLLMILFVFLSLNVANATTSGLNVVLNQQIPSSVEQGNFVYLDVRLSNLGTDDLRDVSINLVENDYFKIAKGNDIKKELGIVGSNNYAVAKFKVYVNENTPSGLNTVEFKINSNGFVSSYFFDILVEEKNPKISINNLSINTIETGSSQKLTFNIKNDNSVDLNNVLISLDLANVETKVFSTLKGTNQILIKKLKIGESQKVEFEVSTIPDAKSKQYLLPIKVSFEDSMSNSYTQDLTASVRVYSKPLILFKLDSQDIYTIGRGKVSFAISNPGVSTIKGVSIQVLKSDDYEVIQGSNQYVGNLNPDDFQTIQTDVYLKNSKAVTMKVKLTYLDSYNVLNSKIVEVPLSIYNNDNLVSFGLGGVKSSGSSSLVNFFIVLIIAIVSYFIGRKIRVSKSKK